MKISYVISDHFRALAGGFHISELQGPGEVAMIRFNSLFPEITRPFESSDFLYTLKL